MISLLNPILGDISLWLVAAVAVPVTLLATYLYRYVWAEWKTTFKNLSGPPPATFLMGNLGQIIKADPGAAHAEWIDKYGPTFRYRVFLGEPRFFTADPIAIQYILKNAYDFPKPEQTGKFLEKLLGRGVLVAEGDIHKRQRKIMNPSFSPASVRDQTPIFLEKAYELRDCISSDLGEEGAKELDVLPWLGKATLDVIGLAGFDYDFGSLASPDNELATAFRDMFRAGMDFTPFLIAQQIIPPLKLIPTERKRTMEHSIATTRRIGRELIEKKKKAIAGSTEASDKGNHTGKDLLSLLMRANMADDLKPSEKLSDDEVLAQITTFMLAGQETSSTALTWILYVLGHNKQVQDKLREECVGLAEERPSMDVLGSLTYLDAVVHEVLRLYSPVTSTVRNVAKDTVIPLGTPVKGRDGKMIESLHLNRGTTILIPVTNVNKSKDIFGQDAEEFKPERWLQPIEKGHQIPGVWGSVLTFLGGARSCIGYRFALFEIKAILFVLIRSFEFAEPDWKPVVQKKTSLVMRPRIQGQESKGPQMPLSVRAIGQDE